jgi:glycine cleavage system regulatory protein
MTFLAIRKGVDPKAGEFAAVYRCETLVEAARLIENIVPEIQAHELAWSIKRTGRWDSEDKNWVVITTEPDTEE